MLKIGVDVEILLVSLGVKMVGHSQVLAIAGGGDGGGLGGVMLMLRVLLVEIGLFGVYVDVSI